MGLNILVCKIQINNEVMTRCVCGVVTPIQRALGLSEAANLQLTSGSEPDIPTAITSALPDLCVTHGPGKWGRGSSMASARAGRGSAYWQ